MPSVATSAAHRPAERRNDLIVSPLPCSITASLYASFEGSVSSVETYTPSDAVLTPKPNLFYLRGGG